MSVELWQQVDDARRAFEARWQPSSVACVDGELYERFRDQEQLWLEAYEACRDDSEVAEHAAAMCRAYAALTERMQRQRETEFLLGIAGDIAVCIAPTEDSVEYARRHVDGEVIWVSPNAVAKLVVAAQAQGGFVASENHTKQTA
jgi:hypothetical protein